MLEVLRESELRAGLAHELGHFAGGDTRLSGIASYTLATFESAVRSGERGAFRSGTGPAAVQFGFMLARAFGQLVVRLYAQLYFLVMQAWSRRQEVAADALAATVAGKTPLVRLLEKAAFVQTTYELYLRTDVGAAIEAGAMPTDLADGYEGFRARFADLPEGKDLLERLRTRKTDRYDSHPAPSERIALLDGLPDDVHVTEDPPAMAVVAEPRALRKWLVEETMVMMQAKGALRQVPWSQIAAEHFAPRAAERARGLAARLHPHFPEATTLTAMLARVVSEFADGRGTGAVLKLEPRVAGLPPAEQSRALEGIGGAMLAQLFEGALLERGASVDASLGAPCLLLSLEGETVPAATIGRSAVRDEGARATLRSWLARLER